MGRFQRTFGWHHWGGLPSRTIQTGIDARDSSTHVGYLRKCMQDGTFLVVPYRDVVAFNNNLSFPH
jgi:hypothetical protein